MRLKFMATGILVERRSHAAAMLALLILPTLGVGCFAAEIRKGATMQVKPDSIWFEDAAKLTRWQELKKGGDAAALASYQEDALSDGLRCSRVRPDGSAPKYARELPLENRYQPRQVYLHAPRRDKATVLVLARPW